MGKNLTQQARGRGSLTFRVRPSAYRYRIGYPKLESKGKAQIIKLLNSPAHSSPLAKIKIKNEIFFVPAANGLYEGQEIEIGDKAETGNILRLKDIPIGKTIFSIEKCPGKGGKFIRSSGGFATVLGKDKEDVEIQMGKRKVRINENCRAVIGIIAGDGRLLKPLVKAGKKHHMMRAKGRKWHRTSAIKTNAVDHPFGSG